MSQISLSVSAALLLVSSSVALAAGIERTAPTTRILFEEGRYLEFSASSVAPDLEGVAGAGAPTGNIFENFMTFGAAYKADINDRLSYALVFDQPWGVDTAYTGGAPYTGVTAELNSNQITGILAFDVSDRFKVFGGLRAQRTKAVADIPFVGPGYRIETDTKTNFGYMAGAAYQMPDIALRVSLTYHSRISHMFNSTETSPLPPGGTSVTETEVVTPQSVSLEFQTGIASDTLLFGSIRWVDWSEFAILPPRYPAVVLVDYEKDWTTYSLGLGRKFTDDLSGFVQVSYEGASNSVLTTLGPVDGRKSLGVGLSYTMDNVKFTGGITYVDLGKATNVLATQFDDGSALAAGIRIGISL